MLPEEAAQKLITLSEEQSRLSDEFADLEEKKLTHFSETRKNFKSDTACDREWEATTDGIRAMRLRLKMKDVGKELSVLKTFLRHEENKARNLY